MTMAIGEIAVVGAAGHLGSALLRGFTQPPVGRGAQIRALCRTPAQADAIARTTGLPASCDLVAGVRGTSIVILAVRAADFAGVASAIAPALADAATVVSAMGGVSLSELARWLPSVSLARMLPPLSITQRVGPTPWLAGPRMGPTQRASLRELLAVLGGDLEVASEDQLATATAVGACALAYHLRVVELLAGQAHARGLPLEAALTLARASLVGSAAIRDQPVSAIAHPGGATDRALAALAAGGLAELIDAAVVAASARLGVTADAAVCPDEVSSVPPQRSDGDARSISGHSTCTPNELHSFRGW